jgi:hypothetical protein
LHLHIKAKNTCTGKIKAAGNNPRLRDFLLPQSSRWQALPKRQAALQAQQLTCTGSRWRATAALKYVRN